ncbi:MAG: CAP domain-containing protein [Christensenellales bacterium]|nr:CAP domain-containing protein [Christensenellales bacterium]
MYTKGRKAAALLLSAALTAAAGTALAANGASFAGHYTTAFPAKQEQTAGNLLNSDRARYNLAPLTIDAELSRIARIKSQDMRDQRYFAHISPTYGDVNSMLRRFGYTFTAAGENIAHHATVERAQAAFLSSPGHRQNILSRAYTRVGLGAAIDEQGAVYLTQIFVR